MSSRSDGPCSVSIVGYGGDLNNVGHVSDISRKTSRGMANDDCDDESMCVIARHQVCLLVRLLARYIEGAFVCAIQERLLQERVLGYRLFILC